MKKIIISCSLLLIVSSSFAQEKKTVTPQSANKKNEIAINAGIGSPAGNFSKGDYADYRSGFAKTGVHFNLSAVHYFNKSWGVNLLIGGTEFGRTGSVSLADGYKEDSGTDSTTLYTQGNNKNFSVLAGPVFKIPAGKNLTLNIRALIGYSNTHLQGFKVYYEDGLDNALTQREASGGAFALQAGAGIRYNIIKSIAILANVDYFTSKPKINIGYDNYVVNAARKLTIYHESVSGVNATLGIGFIF